MNKLLLKLIMLPSGLWRGMGADAEQLRAILSVKLMMDDRKPVSFGRSAARKSKKPMKNSSTINMIIAFFMGIVYLIPIAPLHDKRLSLFVLFTIYTVLLTFMLITDFSNVLFDTKEKYVIIPKPVNDQTVFLSRILHVFIYLFRVILPMSLPAWIFLGIDDGWKSVLLFPVALLLLIFFTLFLVNACYILILQFAKPERFKEIINSFQIAFTIFILFIVYFLQSVLQSNLFANPDPKNFMWARFLPPYWLTVLWSWIGVKPLLPHTQWLSIVAIVVPILLMWVTVKWLSPLFGRKIGAIDADAGSMTTKGKQARPKTLYKKLAYLLNKNPASQAGFMITWVQTSRSRTFKMRVYPMFAYAPVLFGYLMLMNKQHSFSETWHHLSEKPMYLILLYLSVVTVMQAINYVSYSDQYKAAWVYYSSPLDKPGKVMIGAFKALWLKYFVPFFVIISAFIIWVWGWSTVLDMALAVTNMMLFSIIMLRMSYRNFPFSLMEQVSNSGNRIVKSLLSLMIPGALGAGHFLAINIWWLKLVFLALSAILLWLVWDSYANTSWENMKEAEFE